MTYEALLDPFHVACPGYLFLASGSRGIIGYDDIVEIGGGTTTELGSRRSCFPATCSRISQGDVLGSHGGADIRDDILREHLL